MSQLRIVFSGLAQSWTKPTTVQTLGEVEVAAELQHGMLADRMMRSEERAKA